MNINMEKLKKIIGIGTAIATGAAALFGALSDQKRDEEFEQMKKDIAMLKGDNK